MRILMFIDPYLDPEASRSQQIESLLAVLSDAYNTYADDDEAYLATDYVDDNDVVFGSDNPQAILKAAASWNTGIWNNLHSAISAYIGSLDRELLTKDMCSGLDNSATYGLKKAAMAADNDFYSFAEDALHIPAESGHVLHFRTVLSKEDLAGIQANPASYAILNVPAK